MFNVSFNPRISYELPIPDRLSYDYGKFLQVKQDINIFKLYKGMNFSTVVQIIENTHDYRKEKYYKTEKGNSIVHIQGAFNKAKKVTIQNEYSLYNLNDNGWNPYFMSILYNNKGMQSLLNPNTIDSEHLDYFGNSAQFYSKQ